jgi:hypothetical protein
MKIIVIVNINLFPLLTNYALCHEDMWGVNVWSQTFLTSALAGR